MGCCLRVGLIQKGMIQKGIGQIWDVIVYVILMDLIALQMYLEFSC